MSLIVEKFGGTSLGDIDKIKRAAAIAAKDSRRGDMVVVVVSAPGGTTDDLIAMAKEIDKIPCGRELDMLMSAGEQISAALMSMALMEIGVEAVSLCGWQAGINTDSTHGNAVIKYIDTARVLGELRDGRVVVAAGFQGVDQWNDITTIGRGGSDTTAVALAAALGADICRIYTDVDGVYSADPAAVPTAFRHKSLGYDEMLEMSRLGAKVLHDRSVAMAKRYGVTIEVKKCGEDEEGTVINGGIGEKASIVGAALGGPMMIACVSDGKDQEKRRKLFAGLAKKGVNIDTISWGEQLAFTSSANNKVRIETALAELFPERWRIQEGSRMLSIIGSGITSAQTAGMLECLAEEGIGISGVTSGNISVSALVDEEYALQGLKTVHRRFLE
ncbi:MAG: aspartate kinase [Clostridiaceae bacterium]|nr:aspartate kinase [Clostridiaceae bacterium]